MEPAARFTIEEAIEVLTGHIETCKILYGPDRNRWPSTTAAIEILLKHQKESKNGTSA